MKGNIRLAKVCCLVYAALLVFDTEWSQLQHKNFKSVNVTFSHIVIMKVTLVFLLSLICLLVLVKETDCVSSKAYNRGFKRNEVRQCK